MSFTVAFSISSSDQIAAMLAFSSVFTLCSSDLLLFVIAVSNSILKMPTISSRRAASSSALKSAEAMLGTAAVFSEVGALATALRSGVDGPLPDGDAAEGTGLVCVAAGLLVFFGFEG